MRSSTRQVEGTEGLELTGSHFFAATQTSALPSSGADEVSLLALKQDLQERLRAARAGLAAARQAQHPAHGGAVGSGAAPLVFPGFTGGTTSAGASPRNLSVQEQRHELRGFWKVSPQPRERLTAVMAAAELALYSRRQAAAGAASGTQLDRTVQLCSLYDTALCAGVEALGKSGSAVAPLAQLARDGLWASVRGAVQQAQVQLADAGVAEEAKRPVVRVLASLTRMVPPGTAAGLPDPAQYVGAIDALITGTPAGAGLPQKPASLLLPTTPRRALASRGGRAAVAGSATAASGALGGTGGLSMGGTGGLGATGELSGAGGPDLGSAAAVSASLAAAAEEWRRLWRQSHARATAAEHQVAQLQRKVSELERRATAAEQVASGATPEQRSRHRGRTCQADSDDSDMADAVSRRPSLDLPAERGGGGGAVGGGWTESKLGEDSSRLSFGQSEPGDVRGPAFGDGDDDGDLDDDDDLMDQGDAGVLNKPAGLGASLGASLGTSGFHLGGTGGLGLDFDHLREMQKTGAIESQLDEVLATKANMSQSWRDAISDMPTVE